MPVAVVSLLIGASPQVVEGGHVRTRSVAVVCASILMAAQVLLGPTASAESETDRAADRAAIEKLFQQDIDATISRDAAGLTDLWTDDAVRLGGGQAEVGKRAIQESLERQTANKGFKVLSYVPETRDLTFLDGGWAVVWRQFTGSYADSPAGEVKQGRGTVLMVLKKLPNGTWKVFRGMGTPEDSARRRYAVNPPGVSPLVRAYSVAVRQGDLVFVSGMTGFKPGTQDIVEGGTGPQTRQALENIRAALQEAGAEMSDVGECTVFLVDMADYGAMNGAYIEFFPAAPPARATVAVSALPRPAARVEIKCSAVIQRR